MFPQSCFVDSYSTLKTPCVKVCNYLGSGWCLPPVRAAVRSSEGCDLSKGWTCPFGALSSVFGTKRVLSGVS